jgi:hypothetical protein
VAQSVQRLRDSNPGSSKRCFFYRKSRPTLDHTQPPIQRVQQYFSARVKRPRREGNLVPPSSAEIKNEWSCTSKTPVCFRFPSFASRSSWCTASPSAAHSRLEQVLIPTLCMPIPKIKSSKFAPDNGYPTWGFRVLPQHVRTTTELQKVSTSSWGRCATWRATNDSCTCATRHMVQPTLVYCQQHSARQGHMTPTTAYSTPVTNFLIIYRRRFLRCRRSETTFGLMEGPWDCGLTGCDQSHSVKD